MLYRKLKRVWSHNDLNYIPKFRDVFPELRKVDSEELADRFIDLGLDFYTEKETPVKPWIRITLPFALIFMLLMFIVVPFKFMVTGKWSYSLGEKNYIYNWFKSLKLL